MSFGKVLYKDKRCCYYYYYYYFIYLFSQSFRIVKNMLCIYIAFQAWIASMKENVEFIYRSGGCLIVINCLLILFYYWLFKILIFILLFLMDKLMLIIKLIALLKIFKTRKTVVWFIRWLKQNKTKQNKNMNYKEDGTTIKQCKYDYTVILENWPIFSTQAQLCTHYSTPSQHSDSHILM